MEIVGPAVCRFGRRLKQPFIFAPQIFGFGGALAGEILQAGTDLLSQRRPAE